jgi:hypothetical protein
MAKTEVKIVPGAEHIWNNLETKAVELLDVLMERPEIITPTALIFGGVLRVGVPAEIRDEAAAILEVLHVSEDVANSARGQRVGPLQARIECLSRKEWTDLQVALVELLRVSCHRGE